MEIAKLLRRLWPYTTRRQKVTLVAITVGNAIATLALTLPSIVIGNIVSQLTVDRAASIGYEVALLVGLFLLFAFLRAIIHIALHNVMPGVEVVLRYEQILHTLRPPLMMEKRSTLPN